MRGLRACRLQMSGRGEGGNPAFIKHVLDQHAGAHTPEAHPRHVHSMLVRQADL